MADQRFHGSYGDRDPYGHRHRQRIEMERAMIMQQTSSTSSGIGGTRITLPEVKPEGVTDEEIYYSLIN